MPDGSPLRGLPALSIVRDLGLTADAVHPAGAITGLDLTTGAGILNLGLYVRDPFSRTLRMRLLAEVLDHAGTTDETVEVIRDVGPAGDQSLVTPFVEPLAFNGAFASDDPNRMVAIVGFIHARIRVTGTLWVPDPGHPDDPASSLDPGFVHTDVTCIDLVHEKQPPEVTLYLDRSAFSLDQVNAVRAGEGTAHFPDSFLVAVQDRTSPAQQNPVWPTAVLNEAKGLILGRQPAAGLFDDIAHAP